MHHENRRHSLVVKLLVTIQVHHVESNSFSMGASNTKMEPRFITIFELCASHIWRHDATKFEIDFWSAALAAIHCILVRQRIILAF